MLLHAGTRIVGLNLVSISQVSCPSPRTLTLDAAPLPSTPLPLHGRRSSCACALRINAGHVDDVSAPLRAVCVTPESSITRTTHEIESRDTQR